MSTKRGFTLIELLVVIAIIGILSSVVLASLNSARTKSRDANRITAIKQIQLANELYFDSNASYASTTALLEEGGFLPSVPVDPVGSAAYLYEPLDSGGGACTGTETCTSYYLAADLEGEGHSVLSSDADNNGAIITDGADDTDGCTGTAGRYCYDVEP